MSGKRTPVIAKREKRLSVFFHDHEYATVLRKAKAVNIRPSELLRNQLLNGISPVKVPELNLEAWQKLARAAGNLNQIARFMNEGMRADVNELYEILAAFRLALVTAGQEK